MTSTPTPGTPTPALPATGGAVPRRTVPNTAPSGGALAGGALAGGAMPGTAAVGGAAVGGGPPAGAESGGAPVVGAPADGAPGAGAATGGRARVPMGAPAAELRDVTREYGGGNALVRALDGVSIAFPAGSWTAVMGPSGSGKSTLLHCAAGLDRVTRGRVLLAGQEITGAPDAVLTGLRRRTMGFVFQSFNLIGSLTAEQNVALPLKLAGARVRRDEVRAVLAAVGLGDRLRHRPRELSGGQQQRVAIARAMVTRPAVLFADEPTGALDSASARTVLGLLRAMVDREGQSIAMVTHDPAAAAHADAVVFMSDGRLVDRLVRPTAREVADRLARLEAAPC
ncbi:ABC transporter ATP-binding protein [Actinomadura nitritigenes]|uniref:ABC transporter ATP-binding protein n=2 Tax=Thermomonosporaceae TaxID=2012 RepID=UPI003D9127DA